MMFELEKAWVTASGLPAVIIRVEFAAKHRCGYVGLPEGHPLFNANYEEVDAEVHGGLTYGDKCATYPMPTTAPTKWFGFDCGHHMDNEDGGRSLNFCIYQCESLAEQLK